MRMIRIIDVCVKYEYELVGELKKANYEACRLPGPSVRNTDLLVISLENETKKESY